MTLYEIKAAVASYLERSVSDLTQNGVDLGLVALNQVRKQAELHHDFEFSRKLVTVSVDGVLGGSLENAIEYGVGANTVTVTGTLSPALTGTYVFVGSYNARAFYVKAGATAYALWNNGTNWYLAAAAGINGTTAPTVGFSFAGTSVDAEGSYAPFGGATGTATVVTNSPAISIKTIVDVGIFDTSGNLRSSEWTTVSESLVRSRSENPYYGIRYPTDGEAVSGLTGTRRFIFSGNKVFYFPKDSTATFTVGFEAYCFERDWTDEDLVEGVSSGENMWTLHAHQYLQWASVVHLNNLFKQFVFRQEGNLPPPQDLAASALETFIEWDVYRYESFRRHGR